MWVLMAGRIDDMDWYLYIAVMGLDGREERDMKGKYVLASERESAQWFKVKQRTR